MPSEKAQTETLDRTDTAGTESIWQKLKDRLESERRRINEEIEHYPPPIPRCDAQFNYLLEERASVARELSRLEALASSSRTAGDARSMLDEFIASSSFLRGDAKQQIHAASSDAATTTLESATGR